MILAMYLVSKEMDVLGAAMMPHFIYCANYYYNEKSLTKKFLRRMKEFGIEFTFLTTLRMRRIHLITKEKAIEASE